MTKFTHVFLFLALIIGIMGRFWGAWVNNESNDDHVEVVLRILNHESIADKDDCWECFQPPIFYQFHASLSKITGAQSRRALIQQMQLVNAFLSLISIILIQLMVTNIFGRGLLSKWALIFLLINPALFGLSIQGTNDMPVVVLGTLCTFLFFKALKKSNSSIWWMIFLGLATFLAAVIKGNGLAIFLMFSTLYVILAIYKKQRLLLLIPVLSLLLLITNSHYANNHKAYGNAFITNLDKPVPPPLFENGNKDYIRYGITSVWNGFAKFRIVNMLEVPYNINLRYTYPIHRTSFWSQLYGSFFDVQFLQHPYSWENKNLWKLNLTRIILILGLFTIPILVLGMYQIIRKKSWNSPLESVDFQKFIGLLLFLGMLAFNIKYAYDYRDFGCIKAIFMLPVLAPMLFIFMAGWKVISNTNIRTTGIVILSSILFLWLLNVSILITQLTLIAYGYIVIV